METFILTDDLGLFPILKFLNGRIALSEDDKKRLVRFSKGNEGENAFLDLFQELYQGEGLVIANLRLNSEDRPLQIDLLLIESYGMYVYEVKNYRGNYTRSGEYFQSFSGGEFLSPANQLTRTTSHFSQLLKKLYITLPIQSFVVFIHPEFTLYEAKTSDPFIFPGQIPMHFKLLNQKSGSLLKRHRRIVEKLLEESNKEILYQRKIPTYNFEHLRKGLVCYDCGSFSLNCDTKTSECNNCGHTCSMITLILDHINEFQTLFPKEKLTRNKIHEWCGGQVSERRITATLNKYFIRQGHAHSSHYIKKGLNKKLVTR